jgi:hypothetical protein
MLFTAEAQRSQREAQSSCHDGVVVEWGGKPEIVILTRRRGDAEIGRREATRRENEHGDSGGTWTFGSARSGFRRELMPRWRRGGVGWETGDCDFDAETRRRGDRRREATRRENERGDSGGTWTFGSARSGFRRENQKQPAGTRRTHALMRVERRASRERGGNILPIPARTRLGRYIRSGLRSEPRPWERFHDTLMNF